MSILELPPARSGGGSGWGRAAAFVALALTVLVASRVTNGQGEPDPFQERVRDYYSTYSSIHPSGATDLGLHDHDSDLDDCSAGAVAREIDRLRLFEKRFA